jgi:hypothetical protein
MATPRSPAFRFGELRARDHPEPAKIDIAGDEIGRCFQKCPQALRQHVGVKTFRRTPVLVNEPDIGIIDGPVQIIVEASGL